MNKGIIIVVMVIIIGIVIAIGMNYNKEDENKNIIDFDEIKKIINDAGYSIDDLKDIDDDTIKQKLSDMGFSDDEIDKIMEKIDEYKKTEESKTEDSANCIPAESISNAATNDSIRVVSNDDNEMCPVDLTSDDFSNPNTDDKILQNCFYIMLKDSSGQDVEVNAYCYSKAIFEVLSKGITDKNTQFDELNKLLKKCGIKLCEDAIDTM